MSSILKALKKLENERLLNKPTQQKIDDRILQDNASARLSRTTVVLVAIALFVCGSAATYVYMKRDGTNAAALLTIPSLSESSSQQRNTVITPPALNHPSASPRLSPMTKLPGLKNRLPRDPTKSITVLPAKQADVAPEIDSKPVSASSPAPKRVVSRPVLTINGIAFQDGGNENLAVINGITVSSGALIEGVLVEEIQKDRVRFSQSGEKFEIILNKTNR